MIQRYELPADPGDNVPDPPWYVIEAIIERKGLMLVFPKGLDPDRALCFLNFSCAMLHMERDEPMDNPFMGDDYDS